MLNNIGLFSICKTDAEYEQMYSTYRGIDHGNYTKVYDPSLYSDNLPDTVDWRTNNAVTGVKDQVRPTTEALYAPGCWASVFWFTVAGAMWS